MGAFQDALILFSFLLEVAVLFYLEKKAWHSIYTPLNFLMLPFTAVLLVTVCIAGSDLGFVRFYYPCLLLWSVGLVLFAIPSYVLAFVLQKNGRRQELHVPEASTTAFFPLLAAGVALLFLLRLKQTLGSSAEVIGSDEFGEDFCGSGIWAHLRQLAPLLLMFCIYFVNRRRWWMWPLILVFVAVLFIYQVKGWLLIAVFAGLSARLLTGKTKLKASFFIYIILFGAIVFWGSYVMSLVVAGSAELSGHIVGFISNHFFHYFTSGLLGLSEDMKRGFPDVSTFDYAVAQFVNIGKAITGEGDMLSPLNPYYYNTGYSITNVRTFFGTLFIFSNPLQFASYTLFLSSFMYLLRVAIVKWNNIFAVMIYLYYCMLLCMGWFDFYFNLLPVLEIPVIILLLMLAERMIEKVPARRKTVTA